MHPETKNLIQQIIEVMEAVNLQKYDEAEGFEKVTGIVSTLLLDSIKEEE